MPPVNAALLQKEFDRIDKDGSGTLDREEIRQLLNGIDPRSGITNEELDEFMKEVDVSGDDQIDFDEFKGYWEKNLETGGGVMGDLMSKLGGFTDTCVNMAMEQIKENRALILELTEKWGLDQIEEEAIEQNAQLKVENGEQLSIADLRGSSLPELKQILKKCGAGSRNAALVEGQIEQLAKGGGGGKKAISGQHAKMNPGQLRAAIIKNQAALDKEKGKRRPDKKKVQEAESLIEDLQSAFNSKAQHSGLLIKKGGQTGKKGQAERWFCLEEVSAGIWAMEYYDPKSYKLLGQIPIDEHCLMQRDDLTAKEGARYTLDITCQEEGRTFFMYTDKKSDRDKWFELIQKDSGVQHMEHESDDHDDEMAASDSESSGEEEEAAEEEAAEDDAAEDDAAEEAEEGADEGAAVATEPATEVADVDEDLE